MAQLTEGVIKTMFMTKLTWRVAILPDLGQKALYDKFHLDEPWDSEHNLTLLDQMPDVYAPDCRVGQAGSLDQARGCSLRHRFVLGDITMKASL